MDVALQSLTSPWSSCCWKISLSFSLANKDFLAFSFACETEELRLSASLKLIIDLHAFDVKEWRIMSIIIYQNVLFYLLLVSFWFLFGLLLRIVISQENGEGVDSFIIFDRVVLFRFFRAFWIRRCCGCFATDHTFARLVRQF